MELENDLYYCENCGHVLTLFEARWQEKPFAVFCDGHCQSMGNFQKVLNEIASNPIQEK